MWGDIRGVGMGHEGWVWSKYIVHICEILRLNKKKHPVFLDSWAGFLVHKIRSIVLA